MSVINQVLQDLDARKPGRQGEDPVWAIEPPAVADAPRRIRALTLTVPLIAIAVAALFGQGSWSWQTPAASPGGTTDATMAAGTVGGVPGTRLPGTEAGLPLPGAPGAAQSAQVAAPITIASLRAMEPVEPLAGATPAAMASGAATPATLAVAADSRTPYPRGASGPALAQHQNAADARSNPQSNATDATTTPPASATTAARAQPADVSDFAPAWSAKAWLTTPAPAAPVLATSAGARVLPTASAPSAIGPLASIAPSSQAGTPRTPATATKDAPVAGTPAPTSLQIERTSLAPLATGRPDVHFRNAMLRYHAGQLDESARLLQAALAEDPRHTASRQALAAMLIDRRDHAQAHAVLLEGLSLDPANSAFATMAARLYIRQGDLDGAARTLQAAAGERATPELQATLADVLSRLHRDGEALAHWNSALQRSPAHAGWWLGLAVSLEGAGRAQEARTAYERALNLPGLKADAADYARERLAGSR